MQLNTQSPDVGFNFSYFVETLPIGIDSWNSSIRLDYFTNNLYGFTDIEDQYQTGITTWFTRKDLQGIWTYVSTAPEFKDIVPLGKYGTVDILNYIINTWLVPTTTAAPVESDCDKIEEWERFFVLVMSLPSLFLVILVSFMKRRKQRCLGCCWGRPGVQYPVNLTDDNSRRWAYMAAFTLISYKVLALFEGQRFYKPKEYDDKAWMEKYGWTSVFLSIANIVILGIAYYPLLMCITLRKHLILNILGILYIAPWTYAEVAVLIGCPPNEGETQAVGILNLVVMIPLFIAMITLIVCYSYDLVLNIIKLIKRCSKHPNVKYTKKEKNPEFYNSAPIAYIETLLKKPESLPTTFLEKLKNFFNCKKRSNPGMKISNRILCTMIVVFMVLFRLHCWFNFLGLWFVSIAEDAYPEIEPIVEEILPNMTFITDYFHETIWITYWSFVISLMFSFLFHLGMMVHIVYTYRANMKRLFRGKTSWHFKNNASPTSHMVAGMRYSGYQIAYVLYGYFLIGGIMMIVCIVFAYIIVLPLRDGFPSPVVMALEKAWPSILVGIFIYLVQMIMAKCCFLQERGLHMALNNRRLYHVVSFYLFFFNVILGLFSCLRRILMSLVFGLVLISRLDRCLLMRGFERFDSGYKAYLGMLEVELYHNHPVLKAFIMTLHDSMMQTKAAGVGPRSHAISITNGTTNQGFNGDVKMKEPKSYDKRIVIKWWKMLTLINNPTIMLDRLHKKIKEGKATKSEIMDGVVETAATVGAGFVAVGMKGTFDAASDSMGFMTSL